jgi:hypothetical protein
MAIVPEEDRGNPKELVKVGRGVFLSIDFIRLLFILTYTPSKAVPGRFPNVSPDRNRIRSWNVCARPPFAKPRREART